MPTIEYERNGTIASIEREEYTLPEGKNIVSAWDTGPAGPVNTVKIPLRRVLKINHGNHVGEAP